MAWWLYMIECADQMLYTGTTTSLGRRVGEHNRGIGSSCTAARRPVRLVYFESHPSRSAAQAREAAIKKLKPAQKRALFADTEAAFVAPRLWEGATLLDWDSPLWKGAPTLRVAHFRPESSGHRPKTAVRLGWNDGGLTGVFKVEDRYVLARHGVFGSPVCQDSCVEFFVKPPGEAGYLNFEWNAAGTMLAGRVADGRRTECGDLEGFAPLTPEEAQEILVSASQKGRVEKEIATPLTWYLSFFMPFALLDGGGGKTHRPGEVWEANFFKCADKSSHPHWASWRPLPARNFHLPENFGFFALG